MTYQLTPERRAAIKLSDNKINRALPAIAEIESAIKEKRDKSFRLEVANPAGEWRVWHHIRKAFPEWHNGIVRMKVEPTYVQVYVNASESVPIQDSRDVGFTRAKPKMDNPVLDLEPAPLEAPAFEGETMTGNISLDDADNETTQWLENDVWLARIDVTAWEDPVLAVRIQRAALQKLVMTHKWTETRLGNYFIYRRKS